LVVKIRDLKRQGFAVSKELSEAEIALEQLITQRKQESADTAAAIDAGIVSDRDDALKEIADKETSATAKLNIELSKREKSQEDYNKEIKALSLKRSEDELAQQQATLAELVKNESKNVELIKATKQEILVKEAEINTKRLAGATETDDKILAKKLQTLQLEGDALDRNLKKEENNFERKKILIGNFLDQTQAIREQQRLELQGIDNAIEKTNKRITSVQLEIEALKKKKATIEEIQAKENELANLEQEKDNQRLERLKKEQEIKQQNINKIREEAQAFNDAEKAVTGLADRVNSAAANAKGLGAVLADIGKQFPVTFDPKNVSTEGIEKAQEKLTEYRGVLEETTEEIFRFGKVFSVTLQAQKVALENAIEELEKRIGEARLNQARKTAEEAAKIELTQRRQTASDVLTLVSELNAQILADTKEFQAKIRGLQNDLNKLRIDQEKEFTQFKKDQASELSAFDAEYNSGILKRDSDTKEKLVDAQEKFEDDITNTRINADNERNNKAQAANDKQLDLEAKLKKAREDLSNADSDTKREQFANDIAKFESQLAELEAKEQERIAKEQEKAAEIAKAEQDAADKIGKAKSSEEVKVIQANLKTQVEGINEKFKNEAAYEQKLKDFQGQANAATLARTKELYDTQQRLLAERIANEQAQRTRELEQQEEARAKEEAAEKESYERKRA